jgi:putative protein-disulfide isomerase
VIAARRIDPESEEGMIAAIQQAYYLQAKNPSEEKVLISLASELGLDKQPFATLLNHPSTQQRLDSEITHAHRLGVLSFPSLVFQTSESYWPVAVDYLSPEPMLQLIQDLMEKG